ncbi:MAG: hypothetical protein ACFFA2_11405 [Promethearchaeota archaeon]
MLNEYFKNNWTKILNYNSKINLVEKPEDLSEEVRIPLTPIIIEGSLLYYLFKVLYPIFINDQQNVMDLILSDYEIENKMLAGYLYITKNAGIHESAESIPEDLLKINQTDLEDLENLFNKIQSQILKKKAVKIASVRIFKKRGIDLINTYCNHLEKSSDFDFISNFLDLFQKLIQDELLFFLPEPNILQFLKGLSKISSNLKFSKFFQLIDKLTPDLSTTLIFQSKELTFLSVINKSHLKPNLSIKLKTTKHLTDYLSKEELQSIHQKCDTESVFIFRQDHLLSLILDLVDLRFPIEKESLKLILQKILFGIRAFETHWSVSPRPKVYNTLLRFLLRLIGLNLNLKKLSHWAIPDFIFNIIDTYFGLNSNILIILTDDNKIITKSSLMLEIKNGSLNKVTSINNSEFNINIIESIELFKYKFLEKYGYIPIIIKIDKAIIQKIMQCFFFNYYKLKPFSLLSILKMIKKEEFFQITPELPPYLLLKKRGAFSLLKQLLSLTIDKHEF